MKEAKFKPPRDAHWYKADGTPMFEVPTANGKGMKKPDIRDAVKLGLYPSVTTVLKCIDKPFLTAWFKNQVLDAAIDCSHAVFDMENRPLGDIDRRPIMDRSDEASSIARDRGLAIHKDIEKLLRGETESEDDLEVFDEDHIVLFWDTFNEMVGDSSRCLWHRKDKCFIEHSFADTFYGYAGRVDLGIVVKMLREQRIVCDFKTQNTKGTGDFKTYPEMPAQLAAYAYGLKWYDAKLFTFLIDTSDNACNMGLYYWPDNEFWFEAFRQVLHVYRGPFGKDIDNRAGELGLGKPERIV